MSMSTSMSEEDRYWKRGKKENRKTYDERERMRERKFSRREGENYGRNVGLTHIVKQAARKGGRSRGGYHACSKM